MLTNRFISYVLTRKCLLFLCFILIIVLFLFIQTSDFPIQVSNNSQTNNNPKDDMLIEEDEEEEVEDSLPENDEEELEEENIHFDEDEETPIESEDPLDHSIHTLPTSKEIADKLLKSLLERIGDGLGPIIVGGVGDSGTRGMRETLLRMGVQMLGEGFVNPVSKDSEVYMASYSTTTSNGFEWFRNPSALYHYPIRKAHSLKYNESSSFFEHWNCGRQYIAKMISRSMSVSEKFRNGAKLDPWGFKHPRTSLLLPFWIASLKDKWVFVHVIRDGKDIIEGDNTKIFHAQCQTYYGRPCKKGLGSRLNFWADLNREIFEFALESKMQASQYIAIRIEDMVQGNPACFRRLGYYLNLTEEEIQERIPIAIKGNQGHISSYLGNKWGQEIRNEVKTAVKHDETVHPQFKFWGYDPVAYSLNDDCESLQWMKTMRRKKGPLPGDHIMKIHIDEDS